MAMTTDQLIERTRQLLAESDSTGGLYTDAAILELLNEGVIHMFEQLWVLPFEEDVTLTASGSDLSVTANWSRIESLRLDGTDTMLTPRKFDEIPVYTTEGVPSDYCPEFLDSSGDPILRVYKTPAIDTDFVVKGWKQGAILNTATSPISGSNVPPDWHSRFHAAPAYWAASVLLNMDNLPEEGAFQERRFYGFLEEYRVFALHRFPPRIAATKSVTVEDM